MKTQILQLHPISKTINSTVIKLPTPAAISYMWNGGSVLGVMLGIQILSGILLASHYNSSTELAFEATTHTMRDVGSGSSMRFMHMNGASLFFVFIFGHISRGMLFSSFKLKSTWLSGLGLLFLLMGTAFLGYVLPWGQMSFWGATVITNLVTAIPYVGEALVYWVWGGFAISMATLSRFFTLHFILPLSMVAMAVAHLASLHSKGSNKPSGSNPNQDKIYFHPFFSMKDSLGFMVVLSALALISLIHPLSMGDPENFNPANPLNTPPHIQPEWYFLFAYAILRSIPNKLGGVIALLMSIAGLSLLTLTNKMTASKKFLPQMKSTFWQFAALFCALTWIGANGVEPPYESTGKALSAIYFLAMSAN